MEHNPVFVSFRGYAIHGVILFGISHELPEEGHRPLSFMHSFRLYCVARFIILKFVPHCHSLLLFTLCNKCTLWVFFHRIHDQISEFGVDKQGCSYKLV